MQCNVSYLLGPRCMSLDFDNCKKAVVGSPVQKNCLQFRTASYSSPVQINFCLQFRTASYSRLDVQNSTSGYSPQHHTVHKAVHLVDI